MKLQDSGPSDPKSLQSQNRPRPENRLSISRLDVVHGQLVMKLTSIARFSSSGILLQGLSALVVVASVARFSGSEILL
jgi:hypothetical protein